MKRKGIQKIVYVFCFFLFFQAASFSVFADAPIMPEGDIGAALSSNNNLNNLVIERGTLVPAFSADQTEYVVVGDGTGTPIIATATAEEAEIVIRGYSSFLLVEENRCTIPPSPDQVSFEIQVTAKNGIIKTYHVTVYNNQIFFEASTLSELSISSGSLTPAFVPYQYPQPSDFAAVVGNEVNQIAIMGSTDNSMDALSINNFETELSDYVLQSFYIFTDLNVGFNIFEIGVQNELSNTYSLSVYREAAAPVLPSSNNDLGTLTISEGRLSPEFDAKKLAYTATVASVTTEITVTGILVDEKASMAVVVDGTSLPSRAIGDPIALNQTSATTIISIVVEAEDGSEQTYTLTVTKAEPLSDNNNMGSLRVQGGTLFPAFSADQLEYVFVADVFVPQVIYDEEGPVITVTGIPQATTASVSFSGTGFGLTIDSGGVQVAIAPALGVIPIDMVVTAEDETEKTYHLSVYFDDGSAISGDDTLKNLTISDGVLTPGFASAHPYYAAQVGYEVDKIGLTPVANIGNAKIELENIETMFLATMGSETEELVSLEFGFNRFKIKVSNDGDSGQNWYYVTVYREPAPLQLSGLSTSQGTLSPEFDPGVLSYTAMVANDTSVITVTGTASVGTVSVNGGTDSEEIELNATSDTAISIVVSAEGEADQTYTLTITKAQPSPLSGNNDLSGLIISEGSLTPDFEAGKTNYAVTVARDVTSLVVTGTVADEKASITINGESATSGTVTGPIELVNESTTILIVVEAEDTMVKTYTVVVTKEAKRPVGRMQHIVRERTFGGRTIARFDDARFGLIAQRDESGLIDYRALIRSNANDVRLQIPYADLMTKITEGAQDLILSVRGQEIRISMTVFEGDWLAGMPCETEATFEIHLAVDEAGQTTYTIDFFVVEQLDEKTRLVHRKTVQE